MEALENIDFSDVSNSDLQAIWEDYVDAAFSCVVLHLLVDHKDRRFTLSNLALELAIIHDRADLRMRC